jgi:hypothetical protein
MFAEGRALGEERLQIAEEEAHPESLMIASLELGMLALTRVTCLDVHFVNTLPVPAALRHARESGNPEDERSGRV